MNLPSRDSRRRLRGPLKRASRRPLSFTERMSFSRKRVRRREGEMKDWVVGGREGVKVRLRRIAGE